MQKHMSYIAPAKKPNEIMICMVGDIRSLPLFISREEAILWASEMDIDPKSYTIQTRRFTLKKPFDSDALAIVIFSDGGDALSVFPWIEFMIH